jgi:hypothetical protein
MRVLGACLTSLVALTGCLGGGGGSGSGADSVGSSPSFAQLDLPLSAAPASFESAEYRASGALAPIGASTLYAAGGTGAGVTVGIIDTGIDTTHPEFAGAINPASRDLLRPGPLVDAAQHGTAVAGLIGARRNDAATHGVAFNADLLAIRADTPGSCDGTGCLFDQGDLATATTYAVQNGARVLNFSLGSDTGLAQSFRNALTAAVDADRVLVMAAGNGGGPAPHQPGAFAATGAAGGAAIVVGALAENGTLAAFSNRAGSAADAYLVAPGEGLVTTAAGGGSLAMTGTSGATAVVSGAAAVLISAAPHLSAANVVAILLESARDLGAPGTDSTYGRGMLDLERALQPMGPLSVPEGVSTNAVSRPLAASSLSLGDAFGAVAPTLGPVMALDAYARPYEVALPGEERQRTTDTLAALVHRQRTPAVETTTVGRLGLGLTRGDQLSPWRIGSDGDLAGLAVDYRTADDDWRLAAWVGETAAADAAALGLVRARGILGAPTQFADLAAPVGLAVDTAASGDWRVSLSLAGDPGGALAEFGDVHETKLYGGQALPEGRLGRLGLEHQGEDGAGWSLGLGLLEEASGPLGSSGTGGLAAGDALTPFIDLALSRPLGAGWRAFGEATLGRTAAVAGEGGLLDEVGPLWTTAWAVGLEGKAIWQESDQLTLQLLQPLRVEGGRAVLDVPVARDLEGRVYREQRLVDLAPDGRELDLELGYGLDLGAARLQTALLLRHAPGHDAEAPPELLGAINLRLPF